MKDKISDRKAMEKMTSDFSRMLEGKDFESMEDVQGHLDEMVKGGKVPEVPPKSGLEYAQDIIYDAWEINDRTERITLAKEALSVSADCADAYNLLAEEVADTHDEAKDFYQKGVEAGRRALGEKIFEEDGGHFWGYTPTRPFMRSMAGLYDDGAAEWIYTSALLLFVNESNSDKANRELNLALKQNQFVPDYLLGKKRIPRYLPDSITVGGENEGYCYAHRGKKAWKKVPGALEWLKEQTGIKIISKIGRNEVCACGSKKKFKKCCGAS